MISKLQIADWIALVSLVVGVIAVIVAVFSLRRGNKNTSAATLVALNAAFRDSWERLIKAANTREQQFHLGELMNLFEIACATYHEKSLVGKSRSLMEKYLNNVLKVLIDSLYAEQISQLIEDQTTFEEIAKFLNERPKFLSVTIPPTWYQRH